MELRRDMFLFNMASPFGRRTVIGHCSQFRCFIEATRELVTTFSSLLHCLVFALLQLFGQSIVLSCKVWGTYFGAGTLLWGFDAALGHGFGKNMRFRNDSGSMLAMPMLPSSRGQWIILARQGVLKAPTCRPPLNDGGQAATSNGSPLHSCSSQVLLSETFTMESKESVTYP